MYQGLKFVMHVVGSMLSFLVLLVTYLLVPRSAKKAGLASLRSKISRV